MHLLQQTPGALKRRPGCGDAGAALPAISASLEGHLMVETALDWARQGDKEVLDRGFLLAFLLIPWAAFIYTFWIAVVVGL